MTFNDFLIEVTKRSYTSRQRYGQLFFNTLHEIRPDIANDLRGSENDPFYIVVNENGLTMDRICKLVESKW